MARSIKILAFLPCLALCLLAEGQAQSFGGSGGFRRRGFGGNNLFPKLPDPQPWPALPTGGLLPAPVFPSAPTSKLQLPPIPSDALVKKAISETRISVEYHPEQVRRFYALTDRNGDGYLTMREMFTVLGMNPDTFQRLDRNADGIVSFVEFDDAYRNAALWGGWLPRPKAVEGDSPVPSKRVEPGLNATFAMADQDTDERLGIEELSPLLERAKVKLEPTVFLNRYDSNADFRIDQDELTYAFQDLGIDLDRPAEHGEASSTSAATAEGSGNPQPSALVTKRVTSLLESVDRDENGRLGWFELDEAFYTLNVPLTLDRIASFDVDGDRAFDRTELETLVASPAFAQPIGWLADGLATLLGGRKVKSVIDGFDTNLDGRVSRAELEKVLPRNARAVPIENLMAGFDRDRSGDFDPQEFLDLMRAATGRAPKTPEAPRQGAPAPVTNNPSKPWALLDIDHDDRLTYAELKDYLRQHSGSEQGALDTFQRMDRDANGFLEDRELVQAFQSTGSALPTKEPAGAPWLASYDTNGDGGLDLDEIRGLLDSLDGVSAGPEVYLNHWDRNGDSKLQPQEADAALGTTTTGLPQEIANDAELGRAHRALPEPLRVLDEDDDARISPRELAARLPRERRSEVRKLFEIHDRNLTGFLEAEELAWLGMR